MTRIIIESTSGQELEVEQATFNAGYFPGYWYVRDAGGSSSPGIPAYIDADMAAAVTSGTSQTSAALRAAYGPGVSVAAYGAKADGTTDDTVAIAAAVAAAGTLAAQTGHAVPVRLMAGTHIVHLRPQAANTSVYAGIELPSNVHLVGAGRGATVIKLAASEPNSSGHIIHNVTLGGGDHDITVSDLTIDGNGANQTNLNQGLSFLRATDIAITRVRVQNVFGNSAAPPGETFHFDLDTCARATLTDCKAIGSAGTQGSGFGDNSSTDLNYSGCMAVGMSAGMGFASWHGSAISYTGCRAQLCGTNGFNAEFGKDITYSSCIAGGEASDQAGGYAYANSASLGNSGSGFTINATVRAVLSGCISRKNNTGISVVPTSTTESTCQIIGGEFSDNTANGIYFGDPACAVGSYVSEVTRSVRNGGGGTSNWEINGGVGTFDTAAGVSGPATPSGAAVANPFPFKVAVYLQTPANASFVIVDAVLNLGQPPVVFLRPGETIQANYSTSPNFIWMRA